jgi:DNA-binding HxlR family transcriptional regulator
MRTSLTEVDCSIARTMEIIGDGWTALILRDVFAGITRFEQFQHDLDLSPKTLASRLDRLVEDGILERCPYSEHPPRYDYIPTDKGADLFPVIAAVMRWGDRWTAGPDGPPALIRHNCGAHATPAVICDQCGKPLALHDITAEAGPGGKTGRRTQILGPLLASRRREGPKRGSLQHGGGGDRKAR